MEMPWNLKAEEREGRKFASGELVRQPHVGVAHFVEVEGAWEGRSKAVVLPHR